MPQKPTGTRDNPFDTTGNISYGPAILKEFMANLQNESCQIMWGEGKRMSNIDCKQIAYYGKPIDSLTRDELIKALEELAGAIHECAAENKKCGEIININAGVECKGE